MTDKAMDEQALRIAGEMMHPDRPSTIWVREFARRLRAEWSAGQEPVAILHDDGCFTWKKKPAPHESQYAGWRMEVYAAPVAKPAEISEQWSGDNNYGLTFGHINDLVEQFAAALIEAEAELDRERKAREDAERGQRELCVAIGTTTDEWAFSNQRSHNAEQRAADLQRRLTEVEAATIERAAVTMWNFLLDYCTQMKIHPGENNQLFRGVQEIRALAPSPAAGGKTESAAEKDR